VEDVRAAWVFLFAWTHKTAATGLDQPFVHRICALGGSATQTVSLSGEGQLQEDLQYDYLLFFSNFNGTWNQYIDAFSAVLSKGLNLVWRWSEKFPGSVPVTPFKQYIARVQFDTDYYYTAYPHTTANDLKSAHIVQASLDSLCQNAQSCDPEQFADAYLRFVLEVQSHLGETGEAPTVF